MTQSEVVGAYWEASADLEIFIRAKPLLSNMAKKGRGRRSRLAVIKFEVQGALATLADETNITVVGPTFTKDFFAISADVALAVRGLTAGEGDPMQWGMAHGDYTVAEIAEWQNSQLTGPDENMITQEHSRRKCRRGGYLKGRGAAAQVKLEQDADIVRIPLKFGIAEGEALGCWVKNKSGAALQTGAIQEWSVTLYGRWT